MRLARFIPNPTLFPSRAEPHFRNKQDVQLYSSHWQLYTCDAISYMGVTRNTGPSNLYDSGSPTVTDIAYRSESSCPSSFPQAVLPARTRILVGRTITHLESLRNSETL